VPALLDQQRGFARSLEAGADARYAVYRGNVRANCGKALAGAYPIVRKIVGDSFFEALAARFIAEHPSASGDLNQYGAEMAAFLGVFEPVLDLPYLADVARMEWLAHRAYFAGDTADFHAQRLAALAGEAERLYATLAASCGLLASDWPLGRIWTVHQDDYSGSVDVDLCRGGERILVHRPHWGCLVQALAPGDFAFLSSCAAGAELGCALEAACAADADFQPGQALARWIDARVIAALDPA
jgi:uncharacterized protein